jgi:hypothetical protein
LREARQKKNRKKEFYVEHVDVVNLYKHLEKKIAPGGGILGCSFF